MAGFLLVLLLFITPVAWLLYRFMTADGDLTLLRHGPALRKAVENKVVWITGASQGIGPNVPSGVVILPFDIAAGVEAIQQAVTKAEAFFDGAGVDYIVHNAAHTRPKFAALDASEQFLKDTFALNVFGTIHLTHLLVPSMIKRGGGNVVVVSSIAGKLPSPAQTIYAASKHAVNGYFHSLRAELADKNIKVTIACPGPIKTTPSAGNLNSVSAKLQLSERRLSVSRCAELITIAATHGLKEVWISQHPMLLLLYVTQYLPSVGYAIIDKIGPKRVSSQGQDAYSVKLFFGGRKKDI